MNKLRGFTVIEMLTVIAIIAVLATVILTNLNSASKRSKDSAIIGNLSSLITRGTVYIENNGSYTNFCASSMGGGPVKSAIESSKVGGTFLCIDSSTNWCACSPLKVEAGHSFCVDSSNYRRETGNDCDARCVQGVCSD